MGVLFDLDGVVADSGATIMAAMNDALDALGFGARPEEELRVLIGPPLAQAVGEFLGLSPQDAAPVVAAYRSRYTVALRRTRPYPGMAELIRGLREPAAVATSKAQPYAGMVVEVLGLTDAFAFVAAPSGDTHSGKEAVVRDALSRMDAWAMVGDRKYDMEAARATGLRAIGVLWGYGTREELEDAGADVLVATPDELRAAL